MDDPRKPKTVTLAQAKALLPQVRPLLEQLQALQHSIRQTAVKLEELNRKLTAGNGHPAQSLKQQIEQASQHQLQLLEAYQSVLKRLEELDCHLKDPNTGLVDFLSERKGQLVFLCWKLGEDTIRHWHTLEDGFAGRQPLE
jgi:hypothetical protein